MAKTNLQIGNILGKAKEEFAENPVRSLYYAIGIFAALGGASWFAMNWFVTAINYRVVFVGVHVLELAIVIGTWIAIMRAKLGQTPYLALAIAFAFFSQPSLKTAMDGLPRSSQWFKAVRDNQDWLDAARPYASVAETFTFFFALISVAVHVMKTSAVANMSYRRWEFLTARLAELKLDSPKSESDRPTNA